MILLYFVDCLLFTSFPSTVVPQLVSASFAMFVALIDYNPIVLCRLSAVYQLSIDHCSQMVSASFAMLVALIIILLYCVDCLLFTSLPSTIVLK
jgi:hypothetical protein